MLKPEESSLPPKLHRSYIRRKRCLNESINLIQNTLRTIAANQGQVIPEKELKYLSKHHAQSVEACCWTPRLKIGDEEYQQLTYSKTQELCSVLLRNSQQFNIQQFSPIYSNHILTSNPNSRSKTISTNSLAMNPPFSNQTQTNFISTVNQNSISSSFSLGSAPNQQIYSNSNSLTNYKEPIPQFRNPINYPNSNNNFNNTLNYSNISPSPEIDQQLHMSQRDMNTKQSSPNIMGTPNSHFNPISDSHQELQASRTHVPIITPFPRKESHRINIQSPLFPLDSQIFNENSHSLDGNDYDDDNYW